MIMNNKKSAWEILMTEFPIRQYHCPTEYELKGLYTDTCDRSEGIHSKKCEECWNTPI